MVMFVSVHQRRYLAPRASYARACRALVKQILQIQNKQLFL